MLKVRAPDYGTALLLSFVTIGDFTLDGCIGHGRYRGRKSHSAGVRTRYV
jgi:hypothetical protein